jgi:diguanylate cyclase (GGDEF)-like protein
LQQYISKLRSTPQGARDRIQTRCGWRALLGLLLVMGGDALAAGPEFHFERLGIEQGLSQASARVVLSDRRGLIWIGTQEGLNRFDGYTIKVWQHDPGDPQSLSDNNIVALHEDAAGALWIGTLNGGLNRYDPQSGRFQRFPVDTGQPDSPSDRWVRVIASDAQGRLWLGTPLGLNRYEHGRFKHYRHDPDDPSSLSDDRVRSLQVDTVGQVWVGTEGGGLNRLDPSTGRFQRFRHQPGVDGSLSQDLVFALAAADNGSLWVGTESAGLDYYDASTGSFRPIRPEAGTGAALGNAPVMGLDSESDGTLWIATRGGGVGRYDPASNHLRWIRQRPAQRDSLSHNTAYAVQVDPQGLVWIGTADALNRFDPRSLRFGHYRHREDQPHSLSHDWVRSFVEDRRGTLWVGTQEGLNRWDAERGQFQRFRRHWDAPESRKADHARALAERADGGLWVGTDAGLDHFDPDSGRFTPINLTAPDQAEPSLDRITTLRVDADGSLWAGTQEEGLIHLDRHGQVLRRYRRDPQHQDSLSHNQVRVIHRDRKGRLWLGTWGGGLCRLDEQNHSFHCHRQRPGDPDSLANDVVRGILEDAEGRLWLSTQGGGLLHFDPDTGRSRSLTRRDGLADDSIYAALADAQGRLWISSNNGLSRYDPGDGSVRNYTVRDGLQSSEFNTGAYYRTRAGELLFGGIGGFNRFRPEQIEDDLQPPRVLFTELLLANRPVALDDGTAGLALPRPLDVLSELRLDPSVRQFSVEFTGLHSRDPARNRFSYRLLGFDSDWVNTDARNRRATYTNLAPGQYTLQVQAANQHGIWSRQPAELNIEVLPAAWQTWWARALYLLGAIALTWLALRLRDARLRAQADRLRSLVEQRTAELEHSHAELERASLIDPLTGLGNRRMMIRGLQQQPFPPPQRQALMLLDIDHFKSLNDRHGHAVGDAVLCALARQLEACCRREDLAARWGGEEFLLRIGVDSEADAVRAAERLRCAIAALRVALADGNALGLTCSIGLACLPFEPTEPARLDWERVLLLADQALYIAKRAGRNSVRCLISPGTLGPDFEQRLGSDPVALLEEGRLRVLAPAA